MPLPTDGDPAAFLYLNPELAAYSNVLTVEQALLRYDALGGAAMPSSMPVLPAGFDPRVYLAAAPDVSGLNRTIRAAMVNEGMSTEAVRRRGVYVATLMHDAKLTAPNTLRTLTPLASNGLDLGVGDEVKVLRSRGDAMYGTVVGIDRAESTFTLSNPVYAFADPRAAYTVFGIRVWDPERQARVAFARSSASVVVVDTDDVVPRADFNVGMYHTLYPDTRGFSFPDTYLDYRVRWKRADEYRIIGSGDLLNISAPLDGDIYVGGGSGGDVGGGGGGGGGGGVARLSGALSNVGNYVFITSDRFWIAGAHSNGSNVRTGGGEDDGVLLAVTPGAVQLCTSNLVVMSGAMPPAATAAGRYSTALIDDTSMRVGASNLLVTPGGVAIGGSDLVTSWGRVSIGDGNVTVTPSELAVTGAARFAADVNVAGTMGVGMSNPDSADARLSVSGDIFATGTLITLSDRRAKSDVRPIEDALGKVGALRGYTFATLSQPERRHTGLLAQEVERVMPEAVYPGAGGHISLAYGNLAGLMVQAINELASRLEALESLQSLQSLQSLRGVARKKMAPAV